jgi:phosphate starvation-inducible PhoH-like protein
VGKRKLNGKLNSANLELIDIEPLTRGQLKVFESEKNLFLHGCAGTGKTYVSLYLAFDDIVKKLYNDITLVRSAVPTREMGFLPGNEEEKSKVYEQPYIAICSELFNRGDAYGILKKHNAVKFITTSHVRGVTFQDTVVIVDEAQNMSFHELDSLITRVGRNCRIIFCGDFFQSDLKMNGIREFMNIIQKMDAFDFVDFGIEDIVRSKFVKDYLIAKYRNG